MIYRTNKCGDLRKEDIGKKVILIGWSQRFRDHGGKKFIDLRDRSGLVQVVFDPDITKDFEKIEELRREDLIQVEGEVRSRPEGTVNEKMKTGEIEVIVKTCNIVSKCDNLPFEIDEEHFKEVNEDLRLKYRYLDLRRREMLDIIKKKSKYYKSLRDFLDKEDFLEVETPTLTRSTPEGARDMLVPSRKHKGNFYALPQSPQLFKQLLMIAGVERYYQIARCYRDEDSRKDRQLEFAQLDLEASFLSQEELFEITERLFKYSFKEAFGIDVEIPFKRITYHESMEKYGSDKPDLRIKGLELKDISDIVKDSNFSVFANVVKNGGIVKGLNLKAEQGAKDLSRKEIDKLIEFVQSCGGKGLAWIKVNEKGILESSITKFFNDEEINKIKERLEAESNDLLLFVADTKDRTNDLLDNLRRHLADKLDLINKDSYEFAWVIDFPMFHWDEETQSLDAEHNPFTMCSEEYLGVIKGIQSREEAIKKKDELINIKTDCYDLTLNGVEIASGARRIHLPEIQQKVFEILGLSKKEIESKFGWFVNAYNYSAPPHRGLALGLDRIVMIMTDMKSIRDVIPFPKNKNGYCPLTDAPSKVDDFQLKELGIEIKKSKK